MAYGASEKNIGKRCHMKIMELRDAPMFPAHPPFRIIGAKDDTYLLEGPWTTQVTWQVKHRAIVIVQDPIEETPTYVYP